MTVDKYCHSPSGWDLHDMYHGQVIFAILVFTLYWKVAKDFDPSNTLNIAAVLFMWTTLPAYGNTRSSA